MAEKKYRSIDEITHNGTPLRQILEAHRLWSETAAGKGTRAELNGADLSRADLSGADLRLANLVEANLSGANLVRADLRVAQLREAVLSRADLHWANVSEADLSWADLSEANLVAANLSLAHLRLANLVAANLRAADLIRADLIQANLRAAELSVANLDGAHLSGANLSECQFGYTVVGDCDLSEIIGLETVKHSAPSSIGIDTIFRSRGKIPEPFLRGAGVPRIFIEYIPSMVNETLEYYSCFLAHAEADEGFVQPLYKDLQDKGVRCWHFKDHAKWGKLVQADIGFSIGGIDKTVVVCSENSLDNPNVIDEIERAVQKETSEKKEVIFPIILDKYVFGKWEIKEWEAAYKTRLTKYWVGDFTGWEDKKKYSESLRRLLENLNRPPAERP